MSYISVLFTKHKKHLPNSLENKPIGEIFKYGIMILFSAWIFQGMRIMNWKEVVIKLSIDIIITVLLTIIGINWIISFIIAHSLNFAFNGQLYAMYTHMGATNVSANHFLNQTIRIANEMSHKSYINAGIAYGSLSRGYYKRTSDIDLRVVPSYEKNAEWKCAFWAVWQRAKAFIRHYPLDLYIYDANVVVKRMRTDELPIMLYERENAMHDYYPDRVTFDSFVNIFSQENINQ